MILLNKNNTVDKIVVTLFEKRLNPTCIYLFVFKSVTNKTEITLFKTDSDDISTATQRFNEFEIATATVFANGNEGQYMYRVYEAIDTSTTNITGMNLLETGKMLLQKNGPQTIKAHTPTTTYKGYGG